MKLDLTSFAFGFKIADSAGNPNWATSLGQGAEYKINEDGTTCELLKGLVYSSIPLSSVETRIGKGGKLYRCDDPLAAVVLASCFTKVYVNGELVDKCGMILLLTRDTSKSHEGRLRLKYTPHNTLVDATGKALFANVESFSLIRKSLGLAEKACWFVYDLNVKNQDELHLSIVVAKKSGCAAYESTTSLHKKWHSLIPSDDAMKHGAVDGANSGGVEALSEPPKNIDRLAMALRYFKAHRGEYKDGEKVNEKIREYFDPLTEADLLAFDDAKFTELFVSSSEDGHMWASHHYVWEKIKKSGCKVSMKFVAKLKSEPFTAEQFCGKNFKEEHSVPDGFGPSVISELQMKFHPREYCIFTKRTARAFEILGFGNVIPSTALTAERYAKVYEITEVIRSKMESMGIGLMRSDDSTPDYLSANEFVDFVCHYEEELAKEFANGDPEPPKEINRLAVAVKLFAAAREAPKGGPNGWVSYDAWAKAARETFAKVDAGMLVAADFDYAEFARKFVYNLTVANAYFKDHDANEKAEVGKFISQNRQSPKAASWYLDKDNLPKVKGLGVGCALNFMMKVRPAEFATYSPMIDKALMSVGLLGKPLPTDPTVESYEQSKALQGLVLAKMHELHIGKAADDESAADYLTVNEFAWWLSDEKNQNLIEKKILEGQKMKTAKHEDIPTEQKAKRPKVNLADADDVLLLRLRAALKTKPFAILAGHSGTGKSRMVRKLAYMTCSENDLRVDEGGKERKEPGNFCMVQVKPNWHDSSDLLGYYSELGKRYRATDFVKFICKAYAYPEVPFFVCLDEMNLAPVEQYFAEYLSAIESRKLSDDKTTQTTDELLPRSAYTLGDGEDRVVHYDWLGCEYDAAKAWIEKNGLTIPRNLFVVGTVNMDESTNQFSRKVLDRAMTIEMTDADFDSFGQKGTVLSFEDYMGDAAVADLLAGEVQATELTDDQKGMLNALKEVLKTTSFAVAYRFANEYALYEAALESTLDPKKNEITKIKDGLSDDEKAKLPAQPVAFDDMVLMKVLPRISGDEAEVKKLFYGEGGKLSDPKDNTLVKLLGPSNDTGSVRKIKLILERGGSYLSFWP